MTPRVAVPLATTTFRELARGFRRVRHAGSSFEAASRAATGYDDAAITQTVVDAQQAVLNGEAVFERDGVAFRNHEFSWPLISAVLWAASINGGRVSVLDFGGALGSSFFQHLPLLSALSSVHWGVVEQPVFVAAGRQLAIDERLTFHTDIGEARDHIEPNSVVLSSVLQYLPDPIGVLMSTSVTPGTVVVVDRTPFANIPNHYAFVQRVRAHSYKASYASWVFSREVFDSELADTFEVVAEFESLDGSVRTLRHGRFTYAGMILKRL